MEANKEIIRDLQKALHSLYDPTVLSKSPLLSRLKLNPQDDPSLAIRSKLITVIQSLKPDARVSHESKAWRIYQVLTYRFVEQISQKEVANDLNLSIRQLRRLESLAVRTLAEKFLSQYPVQSGPQTVPAGETDQVSAFDQTSNLAIHREQELEWLRKSTPIETVEIADLISTTLSTVEPLLKVLKVKVESSISGNIPSIIGRINAIRQALLNILTTAARLVPGGQVQIRAKTKGNQILIEVASKNRSEDSPLHPAAETLSLARQLITLSQGTLEPIPRHAGEVFAVRLLLPMIEKAPVLVIDDNEDALRLFERYLAGTRYLFIGADSPEKALSLVEEQPPLIIVLDVMLPTIDGWELLGRLHNHPGLSNIPIIICTILPQEQLALALGAVEFIQKPVSREKFLEVLDRHLNVSEKEPR